MLSLSFTCKVAACVGMLFAPGVLAQAADTLGAPPRERAFYAVNADPVWDFKAADEAASELPLFLEMLKKSHAGAVRIPVRWRVLEPKKGEWDFAVMDSVIQSMPENVEVLGVLMSVPQWAN